MELIVRSPANGEILARLDTSTPDQVRAALDECRAAQKSWACLSMRERVSALRRLRHLLVDERESIVDLIAKENGKPRFEALVEFWSVPDFIRRFERVAPRMLAPKKISLGNRLLLHRVSWVEYAPMGVIGVIAPWNFPWLLPFCEMVLALVAGNGVVLKPSEVTPLTGLKIQELCEKAGLPKGLVRTIVGDGSVGAELIKARPDKIFFTGSVPTGRKVMAAASEHLIPVNLELGSKDAMIVLEDADLDYATSAAVYGANFNLGQACASVERLLVHESIAPEFTRLLKEKMARVRPEDLGAITLAKQKQTYESHMSEALAQKVEVLSGGSWTRAGRSHAPTLLAGAAIEKTLMYNEETFGPFCALSTFRTDEEAIRKANDTPYGLTASIISRDVARAEKIASRIDSGTVMVNEVLYTAALPGTPWGGFKQSGFGRTHHDEGLYECTQLRHIHSVRSGLFVFKSFWWYPYTPALYDAFQALTERHSRHFLTRLTSRIRAVYHFARMLLKEPKL